MEVEVFDAAVSAVLVAVFVLLLVGVYSEKQRENSLNLVKHGLFSVSATLVTLVLVFWVMVPVFRDFVGAQSGGGFLSGYVVWLHAGLGVVTIGLAVVMIVAWVGRPLGELGCARAFRLMKPALAVWALTLGVGMYLVLWG